VADPALVRALIEVVRANPDDVIGATIDALVRLAGDGLDRLALMDLLWALQLETEALSGDALGLTRRLRRLWRARPRFRAGPLRRLRA